MANKVLQSSDLAAYPFAVAGDILLDTPDATRADGRTHFYRPDLSYSFPGARNGCTIWINGPTMGELCSFLIGNNGVPYAPSLDPANPVHVRPVPGTQVKACAGQFSMTYLFQITSMKHMIVDGENDAFPGMRDGVGRSVYLTKTFGFKFGDNVPGSARQAHSCYFSVTDGGSLEVRGIEAQGNFTGIRFLADTTNVVVEGLTIERVYLHDAVDGEGFYIGATSTPPTGYGKIRRLNIRDCIIARRGAESVQLQQLLSAAEKAEVKNLVVFGTAMDWIEPFQAYQDGCVQWLCDDGNNWIRNSIFDGCGSNALSIFSNTFITEKTTKPNVIDNCLFQGGKGILTYFQGSTSYGLDWIMSNNFVKAFTNRVYNSENQKSEPAEEQAYAFKNTLSTDRVTWINTRHDVGLGAKIRFFDSKYNNWGIIKTNDTVGETLPTPVYMNSGAYEPSSGYHRWAAYWHNQAFPCPDYTPVTYYAGEILADIDEEYVYKEDGSLDARMIWSYEYYKVQITHTTTGLGALNPKADVALNGPVRYFKLSWDAAGVRNDQPGWNSNTEQSNFPPDDFRLVADNFYNKEGMGLYSNPHNSSWTQIQWYRSNVATGDNAIPIPGAKRVDYKIQECDSSKYLSMWVRVRDMDGNFGPWRNSPWKLVA
jgi:hypothetical protein